MGEASQDPPFLAVHEATPSFIDGVPSSPVPSSPAPCSEVPPDAPLPAGRAVVPEQIPGVQDRPSGSSTAPIIISGREDVVESTPPASKIVLGLPAPSAAPLPKGRLRAGATTRAIKRKRCAKSEAGEPSGLLSQHRSKV
ncbi:hypothetical protein Bca4012_083745 [Brassica carinata]